jgi:glycosyltransferase involved in cell wall biosynthesis
MNKPKLLLIVFSADLGSISLENCLIRLFRNRVDLKVHHFTGIQRERVLAGNIDKTLNLFLRFLCWPAMWLAIIKARAEGRTILFQYLSPALFSFPLLKTSDCFMTTDWTRTLFGRDERRLSSARFALALHRQTLRRLGAVLGMSQAVRDTFRNDYLLPLGSIKAVRMPFQVSDILPGSSDIGTNGRIRILFVGGDWVRKGGDMLLQWSRKHLPDNATLTLITNTHLTDLPPRVTQLTRVQSGDEVHAKAFRNHDVLVVPTLRDAMPVVLGEALSYGLAIITTKSACGAPEVIDNGLNGYICSTQAEVMEKLSFICDNPALVKKMKVASRNLAEERYNEQQLFQQYASILFR